MKVLSWIWFGLFLFGLLFFAVGYIGSEDNAAYFAEASQTTGLLVWVDSDDENAIVQYNVDGIDYESQLNAYSPSMRIGEELPVYYDAADPSRFRTPYNDLVFFVFRIIGLCFMGVSLAAAVITFATRKRDERLLREADRITATIVEVRPNLQITYGGRRHPYQVICQAADPVTGNAREFSSRNLYFDPSQRLKTDTVPVAVSGKRYCVDIDSVLE